MGIFDLFSSGNEKKAARAQQRGLDQGRTQAIAELDRGLADYNTYADEAKDYYSPYRTNSEGAASLYAGALGLNGEEGTTAARSAFSTSPGYDFLVDEALRATERSASASGMLGSGNLLAALQDRASGLASQEWNSWLDRLSGLNTHGINIADSMAGISTGQGTAAYNTGVKRADYDWSAETGKGNAEAQYQASKDKSGLNIFNAVTGLLSIPTSGTLGGKIF